MSYAPSGRAIWPAMYSRCPAAADEDVFAEGGVRVVVGEASRLPRRNNDRDECEGIAKEHDALHRMNERERLGNAVPDEPN